MRLGKVESSFGLSYHSALRSRSVCTMLASIQSVSYGQARGALFSPAPLPRHVAAAVFGFLSELRVPMLIITSALLEEQAWPWPTSLLSCLDNICTEFSPFM